MNGRPVNWLLRREKTEVDIKKTATSLAAVLALVLLFLGERFLFAEEEIYAYIPNADDGTISVIDTSQDKVIRTIEVDDQLSDGIEVSNDGKYIFAGNYGKGELIIIDAVSGLISEKVRIGKNMHGIDMTPDGKYLYLASGDLKEGAEYNYITVFDIKERKVVDQIQTNSQSPAHVDFSRDGSLAYVANVLSNDISLIDTKMREIIATIPVGSIPNEVEPSVDDKLLFVANVSDGTVSIVDIVARKEIKSVRAGDGTHGLAISNDGGFVYASNRSSNDLVKIDLDGEKVIQSVLTGKTANHVSVVPGEGKLYITNKDSNDLTVVDENSFKVVAKVKLGKTPHEISFAPKP